MAPRSGDGDAAGDARASAGSGGRADLAWLGVMVVLQVAWFHTRWTMGGNALDATFAGIVLASILAAIGVAAWPRPADATRIVGSPIAGVVALAFLVEVFSALVQDHPTWDEDVVLWASGAFARGGFAELMGAYRESTWLAQRHPPLGAVLFGSAVRAFGDSPFAIRLVTAAFAATTAGATAFVARALYGDAVARRAGWLLVTFPLFVRLGGAVMTDVVVTCLMVGAIALSLDRARRGGRNAGVWLGLLLGAAILVKYTAVLAVPVVVATYAFHGAFRRRRSELLVALLVLALPLLGWIAAAWAIGTLSEQIGWFSRVAGVSLRGVAGGFSAQEVLLTKLPSGVGLYGVPCLALGAVVMWRRGALAAGWLVTWSLLVCVPLLLTLPDNRYFLPAFPAFAVVGALGAERMFARPERALWLALVLGAVTVVFYAVMPDVDPVFLFGTPRWMRR